MEKHEENLNRPLVPAILPMESTIFIGNSVTKRLEYSFD